MEGFIAVCKERAVKAMDRFLHDLSFDASVASCLPKVELHHEMESSMKTEIIGETSSNMTAARVHQFGGIDVIHIEQIPRPIPAEGEVLVKVKAAGVGPWDALIRTGNSGVKQDLPLTLGSDIAGIVVELGPGVTEFELGDAIFGVTNPSFTGGYAEFAIARAGMTAGKPGLLSPTTKPSMENLSMRFRFTRIGVSCPIRACSRI